jgi:hypothetical protein
MQGILDLQVYDLSHLGLVAGIIDRIGLVPLVDERVGPRPQELVSTGVALKVAILNALGFLTSPSTASATFGRASPRNGSWGRTSPPTS